MERTAESNRDRTAQQLLVTREEVQQVKRDLEVVKGLTEKTQSELYSLKAPIESLTSLRADLKSRLWGVMFILTPICGIVVWLLSAFWSRFMHGLGLG
jgi:hypothetical protein